MARDIDVDRLPDTGTPLQVVLVEDASFGSDGAAGRARPAPPRLPRADLDPRGQRRAPDRRRTVACRAGHDHADRPRPGARLPARRRARRRGHPLRGGDAGRRRGRALADRGARRAHGRRPAVRRRGAGSDDPRARGGERPPARRPQPGAPAPLPVRAAVVDRALVRRHPHRTARRRRRRSAAPAPLHERPRARLRAPPRRRPLRRRARRAAGAALEGAGQRHRPHDQAADHRPRDARGRAAAALHAT